MENFSEVVPIDIENSEGYFLTSALSTNLPGNSEWGTERKQKLYLAVLGG